MGEFYTDLAYFKFLLGKYMSKVNNKGVRATAMDIVQASILLTFDFKIVFARSDMYLIQSFVDSQKESLPHKKLGPFLFPIF